MPEKNARGILIRIAQGQLITKTDIALYAQFEKLTSTFNNN